MADADPQVSVLLPARDAAATLDGCLRSIQRQTRTWWHCVLVDDGSRDETAEIGRRFAAADPRFEVLSLPPRGLVRALNAGLTHCRGRFVARMDADDVMMRRRLELQVAELERAPALAAVCCHVRYFPRAAMSEGLRAYERWLNSIDSPQRLRQEAFVECPAAHPSLMIRRALLAQMGYRDRGWPEDYDLVLRLLAAGREIGVVPRRLVCWRDHETRLSRLGAAYTIDRFTACKAAFLADGFLAGGEEYVLWGYGATGRSMRRALLAHGKRPAYVVELHAGRVGQVIHGAAVIAPEGLLDLPRLPIVVSVAGAQPRAEIRRWLVTRHFREGAGFVCTA
jgi:glycosyltransferase involved in cell wall biosynthesis